MGDVPPTTTTFSTRGESTIATVTVSNPNSLNSLSTSVLNSLVDSILSLAQLPNLRCVILTGGPCTSGSAFLSGADLSEVATLPDAQAGRAYITRIHLVCKALRELPVPVIARVNGHALGGGLIIMAAADLRIAASGALFGMPEVLRGVPSTVESALLPAAVGALRARRLLLLGDTIPAETAESWGLIDRVVAHEDLDKAVEEWLEKLLKAGPRALASQKRLMLVWEQTFAREAIEAGVWEFGKAFEDQSMVSERNRVMSEFRQRKAAKLTKL